MPIYICIPCWFHENPRIWDIALHEYLMMRNKLSFVRLSLCKKPMLVCIGAVWKGPQFFTITAPRPKSGSLAMCAQQRKKGSSILRDYTSSLLSLIGIRSISAMNRTKKLDWLGRFNATKTLSLSLYWSLDFYLQGQQRMLGGDLKQDNIDVINIDI